MGGSGGVLGELWEAQGQLWEALAELWEALGELWEGLYIQKLPINRPSGRYVIYTHQCFFVDICVFFTHTNCDFGASGWARPAPKPYPVASQARPRAGRHIFLRL